MGLHPYAHGLSGFTHGLGSVTQASTLNKECNSSGKLASLLRLQVVPAFHTVFFKNVLKCQASIRPAVYAISLEVH